MRSALMKCFLVVIIGSVCLLLSCTGDTGPQGPAGPGNQVNNTTCLKADCHGNSTLAKTIRTAAGDEVTIPLYVNSTQFASSLHGSQLCVGCHTDINADGGAHAPVAKIYGGWARFGQKQEVEHYAANEVPETPNYQTAASLACVTCHTDQAPAMNSAHATIYKLRESAVDDGLSSIAGKTCGENYEVGNCNRCHASCATCHFESTITRAANGSPLDFWDANQTSYPASGFSDKMSEFEMDWTTNVASHDFRRSSYFQTDTEGVCEACHTGLQKPEALAYYWTDANHTTWDSITAANVKRHPQTYGLALSGDPSFQSGGTNTSHSSLTCAGCHGGTTGDVHALPGVPYEWSQKGDVKCTDCHSTTHTNGMVALHFDGSGTEVSCIACHTFGLGRDFSGEGHDVFLDPETNEVRPVVYKHGIAIAWYSHNWQTFNAGTGKLDPNGDCAKKCHYDGNKIGASFQ